jgi:carboxypeptidase Taq
VNRPSESAATAQAQPSTAEAPAAATEGYAQLVRHHRRLHHLEHLQSITWWDQAVHMPAGGATARAEALAELAELMHGMRTDPAVRVWLEQAHDETLQPDQHANLREMAREWRGANGLPAELVSRQQLATAACEHAWRRLRPANDWDGFVPLFREVVACAREQARLLSAQTGLSPYDALLDRHEPGMTSERLTQLFADIPDWLPGLIRQARARQQALPPLPLRGPFDTGAQRALCLRVMGRLGFDFDGGRIDVSAHPFCGGVPQDIRMTTRYTEADFLGSLLGAVHECGHGRYEQNLPRDWIDQPLARARSMGIHESQSLAFEMQLGRHPAFIAAIGPWVREAFGDGPALTDANLRRLMTQVEPGRIRVDADELTYAPHVLLRWRIERPLIEGEIEVEDIPALWDAGMAELLGLDTRGDFKDGPLQDVHWPEGLFGYFPCYTLGAMYAAQWMAALRAAVPDLDDRFARGDFSAFFDWMRHHVWQQGSRWPTDELARRASGTPLDPSHWRRHLEQRYLHDPW